MLGKCGGKCRLRTGVAGLARNPRRTRGKRAGGRSPLDASEVGGPRLAGYAAAKDWFRREATKSVARAPTPHQIMQMGVADLTEDELQAVVALVRAKVRDHHFPHSDRIRTLRAALYKLDPASAPVPIEPGPPLPTGPSVGNRRSKVRR
jgi:hypothetical protein